jgi:uncharacterized protein (DUF983 family)
MSEPVLCPDCGWTGTTDDFDDGVDQCPVCETNIEFVD